MAALMRSTIAIHIAATALCGAVNDEGDCAASEDEDFVLNGEEDCIANCDEDRLHCCSCHSIICLYGVRLQPGLVEMPAEPV